MVLVYTETMERTPTPEQQETLVAWCKSNAPFFVSEEVEWWTGDDGSLNVNVPDAQARWTYGLQWRDGTLEEVDGWVWHG